MTKLIVFLGLTALVAVAGDPKLEDLGSFLEPFYEKPNEKRITDDLEVFNGRIYIAHGYTNTKQRQQTIYYDIEKGAYGRHEGKDGKPLTWPIEKTFKTHVFGNELFILDYDPIHGKSNLLRVQKDGSITTQKPSKDAHNRDVVVFDKTIFVSVGRMDTPWPSMAWSKDDGKTWKLIDQSKQFPKRSLYVRYFVFKNTLYACTSSKEWDKNFKRTRKTTLEEIRKALVPNQDVPWLIRYTGKANAPWEAAVQSPDGFLPEHPDGNSKYSEVIYVAVPADDELIFTSASRLYAATSITPPKITPIGFGKNTFVKDLYQDRDGRGWALVNRRNGKRDMTITVVRYAGKGKVKRIVEVKDELAASCLAIADGYVYLGLHRGRLKRVRLK